jgi:hypothetical protein
MSRAMPWPQPGESVRDFEARLRAEGLSRAQAKRAVAAFKAEQERQQRLQELAAQRPAPRARLLGGR